jgi:hypothetical protein
LSLGVALWGASSQAGTLTTLYSFENVDITPPYDGASPVTGFFADGTGNLYGSTSAGGTSGNPDGIAGYGIEYELGSVNGTTIGSYTNLRRDRHIGVARKQFFFSKKIQKTFTQVDDAPDTNGAYLGGQKFFGSFFQKRTASFALAFLGQRVALN